MENKKDDKLLHEVCHYLNELGKLIKEKDNTRQSTDLREEPVYSGTQNQERWAREMNIERKHIKITQQPIVNTRKGGKEKRRSIRNYYKR